MSESSETELSASIRSAMETMGFWVERLQSGKLKGGKIRLCSPGTPDLLIVAPIMAFVEVKQPGKKLSEEQESWHARARRYGVQVVTLTSVSGAIELGKIWLKVSQTRDWDRIGLGG